MQVSKEKFESVLFAVMGITLALMRPSAIGEVYSFYLALACLVCVFLFIVVNDGSLKVADNPLFLIQSVILFFLALYMMLHSLLKGYASIFDGVKIFLLIVLPIIVMLVASQRVDGLKWLLDAFSVTILISCISIVVSFFLLLGGLGHESLHVMDFQYTYEGRGYVIFPITFTFNLVDMGFGLVPRLSGLFREPGVVPAFACWGAAYAYVRGWPLWVVLIFIMGGLLSLSSLGFLCLLTGFFILADRLKIDYRKSIPFMVLVALMIWPLIYGLEGIGIGAKAESGSESFNERYEQFFAFFESKDYIFGDGPGWSIYETSAINLLAASRTYGGVYLFLTLLLISFSVVNRKLFFMAYMPMVFVVFTAQPIVLETAVLVVWLSWILPLRDRGV